ncbi:response regulator [Nonomuraea sp. SYSU D8015]|uniref:response regulator n=1 Tax=Nonomuraea sp. SYSU D8015 TaxID=2593644 RepID=UPI001660F1B8|nr:response regulator transcription factor [Nonomuraea sp. SYSU D8015]
MTVRVVLADDQPLIRQGARYLIDSADDLGVVGEAADGAQAVELARAHLPDVVVMDIRMPGVDGLAATRTITSDATLTGVRVLVLTTFEIDEYVFEALRAGASGFIGKGVQPHELLDAIRTVARGEALLSPQATKRLIAHFLQQPGHARPSAGPSPLTERELEIVALVASGLTNADIAEQLHLSPATVKTHVNRSMMKLSARDRAQMVVFAYQSGLVSISAGVPRPQ